MTKNNIHIEITNEKGKVVSDYYIHRLSVRDNFERNQMNQRIVATEGISKDLMGHLYSCAAMAVALRDKDGNRIYTDTLDDKGNVVEDAYTKLENDLDFEVYGLLTKPYLELNPLEPSLDAKKKRS